MATLKICNMTGLVDFAMIIDLKFLANTYPSFIVCNPVKKRRKSFPVPNNKFSGAVARFKNPKATCLLFPNGKTVCVGCRKTSDINDTMIKLAVLLNIKCEIHIKIVNIVGTFDYGQKIHFDTVSEILKLHGINFITAEDFPGMTVSIGPQKAVAILFHTGKVIINGVRNELDLQTTFSKLVRLLDETYWGKL